MPKALNTILVAFTINLLALIIHCNFYILSLRPTWSDGAEGLNLNFQFWRFLQLFAKSLSTPLSDREKIEKIPKLPKFKRQSSTALLRTIQPPGTHSVLGSPYDNICHPENDRISMISKEHQRRRATSTIGQLSQS